MNLFTLVNRGVALSGVNERQTKKLTDLRDSAVAATRAKWLNALTVDQTRAWMAIDSRDRGALKGLITVLTLAGLAKAFDDHHENSLEVRIIRGALSAAEQCAVSADCVITVAHARAFTTAANGAAEIINSCTGEAIVHASVHLRKMAGMDRAA